MGIKSKPMSFQPNEAIEEFRNYDPEASKQEAVSDHGMDVRITKTLRMRQRFSMMLKEEAYKQSMAGAKKVSESDLLDEALSEYRLKLQRKAKKANN